MVLFSVVKLKNSDDKLVMRTDWIKGMNTASSRMYGTSKKKQKLVFYSPDTSATPNFNLNVRNSFCVSEGACYYAYIVGTFGKFNIFYPVISLLIYYIPNAFRFEGRSRSFCMAERTKSPNTWIRHAICSCAPATT